MAPGRGATCAAARGAQQLIRARGRVRPPLRRGRLPPSLLELLEPGPLLPDQVLELHALLRRKYLGDLVLHLLDGERRSELDLAPVAGQLAGRAPDDRHDPGALVLREVELVREAAHELRAELLDAGARPAHALAERARLDQRARLARRRRAVADHPSDHA